MKALFNKLQNNFNKNKKLILIFSFVWIFVVVVTLFAYKNTLGKESYGNYNYNNIQVLTSTNRVKQVVDTKDGVTTIAIRLEVYDKNSSKAVIEVIGKDSKTIYGSKTISSKFADSACYNVIELDEALDTKKDTQVEVIIYSTDDSGALGVWYSNENYFNGNPLYVNDNEQSGSLSLRLLNNNETYALFNRIIVISTALLLSLIVIYLSFFDGKIYIAYTMLVFFAGLVFMFIITPISGPDEDYHYQQVLVISNKIIGKENIDKIEDIYIGYQDAKSFYNVGDAYKNIIDHFNDPLPDLSTRRIYNLDAEGNYDYKLSYMPQALGVSLGRILNFNFYKTYYLGRLFSLILYTACVYIALKNTPVLKSLFGVYATLPICLQQSIVYNHDVWIFGLSMVLFAFMFKWKYNKNKITITEFVFVLIIDILLAPCKAIYSLVMLTYLFIPEDRFYSKKHRKIVLALLLAPMVYVIGDNILGRIIPIIKDVLSVHADTFGTDVDHSIILSERYSIRYIVAHPLHTIWLTFNTIKINLKSWFAGATGRYLSGLTLIIPNKLSYCFVLTLLLSPFIKEDEIISIKLKVCTIVISILAGLFTLVTMLVGWTSINAQQIDGVQGRYFTPLLPYIFIMFNNSKIAIPKKYEKLLVFAQIIVVFEVIICILSSTFVY